MTEQKINGQLGLLKKSGLFNQQLSKRAALDNPQIPASARLSPVGTRFHSSTVLSSGISVTGIATKIRCFSSEWNHCSTVLISVYMKHFSTFSETARCIFCRNPDASKTACNSNFGIVRHFSGATLALSKTKANSVVPVLLVKSLPRRKATPPKVSCELSPNICNSIPSTGSWKLLLWIASSLSSGIIFHSRNWVTKASSECHIVRLFSRCPSAGDGLSRCMEQRGWWGCTLTRQHWGLLARYWLCSSLDLYGDWQLEFQLDDSAVGLRHGTSLWRSVALSCHFWVICGHFEIDMKCLVHLSQTLLA